MGKGWYLPLECDQSDILSIGPEFERAEDPNKP